MVILFMVIVVLIFLVMLYCILEVNNRNESHLIDLKQYFEELVDNKENEKSKNTFDNLGFGEMINRRTLGRCPFCNKDTTDEKFKDELSRREFEISGICQGCQDKTFK